MFTQRKFPLKNMGLFILSVILASLILSVIAVAEGNSLDEQFPLIHYSPVMVSVDQTSTIVVQPTDNSILQQSHSGNWESLLLLAFAILLILGISVLKITVNK